jgi:hypothetical protein
MSLDEVKASRPKPTTRLLVIAAIYAPVYFVVHVANQRAWAPAYARPGLASNLILTAIQTIIFSCAIVWFTERRVTELEIFVDDDRICVRNQCITRGQVKTVVERKNGILLSDRGRLATYLFGGVWIPRQLPAYEHLKSLALSWCGPPTDDPTP